MSNSQPMIGSEDEARTQTDQPTKVLVDPVIVQEGLTKRGVHLRRLKSSYYRACPVALRGFAISTTVTAQLVTSSSDPCPRLPDTSCPLYGAVATPDRTPDSP
jgi:hypothetical protein